MAKARLLTAEEEIELSDRIQNHNDEEAFTKLVLANMGLVVYVVQKLPQWHLDSCLTRDDLIQEGNMALMRACRTWKPQSRFASYARKLIHSQVMRAIENKGNMIHVPVPVQEQIRKIKRAESLLNQSLGRDPTVQELAQFTKLREGLIRDRIIISQRQPVSLDAFKKDQFSEEGADHE